MHESNLEKINLIQSKLNFADEYKLDFRQIIFDQLLEDNIKDSKILDFGCSLRGFSKEVKEKANIYLTADINEAENIDLIFDLCDESDIPLI